MDGLNGWSNAIEKLTGGSDMLMNAANAQTERLSNDVLIEVNKSLDLISLEVDSITDNYIELSDNHISKIKLSKEEVKKIGEAFIMLSKGV